MKKKYVKPEIEVTLVEEEQQLLTGSKQPVRLVVTTPSGEPDPTEPEIPWGEVNFGDWEVD